MNRDTGSQKNSVQKDDQFILVEGTVTASFPELIYKVEIEFRGIKHELKCHVSGKMRTNFIELEKGDKVRVRISLYDIDRGIIVRRLTGRGPVRVVEESIAA
jgi:translation initiation factor IF-1